MKHCLTLPQRYYNIFANIKNRKTNPNFKYRVLRLEKSSHILTWIKKKNLRE